MNLTSNGKIIGEIKVMDLNLPQVEPIVIAIITDPDFKRQIIEQVRMEGIDDQEPSGGCLYEPDVKEEIQL